MIEPYAIIYYLAKPGSMHPPVQNMLLIQSLITKQTK